ncbi:putative methyltransferase PMT13-like protein [Trifolium pratense]|uniref:Methyltransferase n=1 Tax=Trifolium pratense TaxID=57577 RepID=A0A2K3P0Y2_TRIPR|nr:putative methyltransferase PMT13-like protein [Trifolium pratense]
MGHPNFPPWKRTNTRQWRLIDLISIAFFSLLFLFFVLFYTTLGGRRVVGPSTVDPQQRIRLVVEIEEGMPNGRTIEACPASEVDHMPCEDPRRNSQLSREMNYYRERHCPPLEETALCLIPPPNGYRVPVRWPESMHKVWCLFNVLFMMCIKL